MKFLTFGLVTVNTDHVTRITEQVRRGEQSMFMLTLTDDGPRVDVMGEDDVNKLKAWMDQAQWQSKQKPQVK